jgi:steroid delta-isomerase-like uncharacterized protein
MSIAENKALIRRLYEETDKANVAVLDELIAVDCVDHNPAPVPDPQPGLAGFKQAFAVFRQAHPDGYHILDDMIAEDDKVMVRVTGRGTHTGDLLGIPATGKVLEMTGIAIYRIAEGKIVERWAEHNLLGLLQQLGVVPSHEEPQQGPRGAEGAAS